MTCPGRPKTVHKSALNTDVLEDFSVAFPEPSRMDPGSKNCIPYNTCVGYHTGICKLYTTFVGSHPENDDCFTVWPSDALPNGPRCENHIRDGPCVEKRRRLTDIRTIGTNQITKSRQLGQEIPWKAFLNRQTAVSEVAT